MSQLFQRRPSRDPTLYTSTTTITNNTINIRNTLPSSSLSNGDIMKNSYHPMLLLSATDESEDDRLNRTDMDTGTGNSGTSGREDQDETNPEETEDYEDSGHEDDEDLVASEEIILPDDDDDENEEEEEGSDDFEEEAQTEEEDDESKIFKRQMSYPPIPQYIPPNSFNNSSKVTTTPLTSQSNPTTNSDNNTSSTQRRPSNPRERLGVLTPMEEVTEPPSSAGTEASGIHQSRRRKRGRDPALIPLSNSDNNNTSDNGTRGGSVVKARVDKKSILKSKSPTGSPERRVKFVGAGSITPSERTTSPAESLESNSNTSEYSSMVDSGRKSSLVSGRENSNGNNNVGGSGAIPEETEGEEDINDTLNMSPTINNNKSTNDHEAYGNEEDDQEGSDSKLQPVPVMENIIEKIETWQLGSDSSNDDPPPSAIDSEFASILDDIIAELHSWDRLAGTGAGITEINASRQDHLANVSSQLASYLSQVSPPTIMTNLPQIIPLVTTLLSVTEQNFRAQLTSLNTVNVFIDKLRDCKNQSGLKVLPNADLTWLIRTLCDISSESSRSVLKSEGTATLAKLVKAAGPEMICEPILFILMGNDEKIKKTYKNSNREGSGNIVTTGVPGGAPKIKATALDTLTFALLTFPRDNFDLDVVAKLACHCLLHSKRRVRQAALECLAVVSHAMGPNHALPMFRQFISEEENGGIQQPVGVNGNVNASNSSISSDASGAGKSSSGSGSSAFGLGPESAQEPNIRLMGPPSRIPVPISKLQANNVQAQAPVEPQAEVQSSGPSRTRGGPSPSSAVSARISRHVLPSPSLEELVEYAVKIPAKCQVLSRQSVKIGGQHQNAQKGSSSGESASVSGGSASVNGNSGSERLSSSGESNSSISNIDYSLLELEPVLNSHGSGVGQRRRATLTVGPNGRKDSTADFVMAPDILWILNGTGPVKKYDPASRFPKETNNLNRSNSQQWAPTFINNSSGADSDFNNSSASQRTTSSSDFNMRRINNRGRVDLQQMPDSLAQDPVLGRYYYPPPNHISPRGGMNSSDSMSSRMSSKSAYGLLPNKYSILQNSHSSPRNPLHHQHPGHDLLLPGAYDNPFGAMGDINGYNSSGSYGHTDYGNYSRRPQALQPISSLREKFFESTKRHGGFNSQPRPFRSESPTSEDEEEEEEDEGNEDSVESEENEKTEPAERIQNVNEGQKNGGNQNGNKNGRKPQVNKIVNGHKNSLKNENGNQIKEGVMTSTKSVLINKANAELTSIQKQGEEFAKGVNREFQVYHHQIEVEPTGHAAAALAASMTSAKRGDVDSAGSNNTRDSGVSLGSLQGTKSPPSVNTTPPSQHRTSDAGLIRSHGKSASQKSTKSKTTGTKSQLNRNWQSTPDVPTASDTEDGETQFGNSRRNHSNSPVQFDNRLQAKQVQAQTSSSENIILLHRKPVLARRNQSVPRVPVPETMELETIQSITEPQMRRLSSNRHKNNRKGSGDKFLNQGDSLLDVNPMDYSYGTDGSLSPNPYSTMRNSMSTGNLVVQDEDERSNNSRLTTKSKSTYLEIDDEEDSPSNNNNNNRKGRLSQRNGPFGDVRASTDFSPERKTLPRKNNANSTPSKINGKIVPTKVYKGSFREINSRKASNGSNSEVFPADLKPVTSARHALPAALTQLQSNEWETNVDGFRQIVRIIRYNPETIRADLHNVNMAGIRHVANLRSQVCRSAILCFREMFMQLGKSMEADSEKIAEKLLDKSADTNKFIREDSGRTLDAMIDNLTPTKGLTCLDLFGTRHRNPAVRCMAAKMTTKLVLSLGADRCLTELPERLLPMLCKLLQEGGLETRTTAKTAISHLMTHPSFNSLLKRYVSADILRHAQKSIDSLQK